MDQIPSDERCNCRNKNECPLPGKCLIESVIYQGSVKTATGEETYIGLTANSFKARFGGHKSSFKSETRIKETTLSKYIWELKKENIPYTISWKVWVWPNPSPQ